MAEKSGIEMLEEILERLGMLEKELNVMDKNIKSIMNSANLSKMVDKIAGTKLDTWARATKPGLPEENDTKAKGFQNFSFETVDAAKMKNNAVANKRSKPTGIMINGKLKIEKNGKTAPLSGAIVKIFDEKDKLIKSTKTNKAGHWVAKVMPGKYIALFEGEVDGKSLLPQNKNFEVPKTLPEGQVSFEVV